MKICLANSEPSTHGPSVWTGRALQAENDELEKVGLALLYPAYLRGPLGSWPSWIIRARSISFATRPRRPEGPPDHERAGETFFSISSFQLADLGGKANYYLRGSVYAVSRPLGELERVHFRLLPL